MKITKEDVKMYQKIGTFNNLPVVHFETHGGLHGISLYVQGVGMEIVAASPHKGISVWMASKKYPEIRWDRGLI